MKSDRLSSGGNVAVESKLEKFQILGLEIFDEQRSTLVTYFKLRC